MRKDAKPGPSISLAAIAQDLAPTAKTRGDREPGLSAEGWFKAEHQVYPYGTTSRWCGSMPRPARVTIERYWIAYDIGRAINPALVRGQIVGGFAQGVGGALFEEFTYSDRGDPLAVTFADYLLPSLHEIPDAGRDAAARTIPRRSIRSASKAPAKAASPRSARRSLRLSTMPSAFRAR